MRLFMRRIDRVAEDDADVANHVRYPCRRQPAAAVAAARPVGGRRRVARNGGARGRRMPSPRLSAYLPLAGDALSQLADEAPRSSHCARCARRPIRHRIDRVELTRPTTRSWRPRFRTAASPACPGTTQDLVRINRARHDEPPALPGRTRQQLPADHEPRRGAGAAPRTTPARVGEDKDTATITRRPRPADGQQTRHHQHGHDRAEAAATCAPTPRRRRRWRRTANAIDRPQMVLGADVGCVSGARAGARRR